MSFSLIVEQIGRDLTTSFVPPRILTTEVKAELMILATLSVVGVFLCRVRIMRAPPSRLSFLIYGWWAFLGLLSVFDIVNRCYQFLRYEQSPNGSYFEIDTWPDGPTALVLLALGFSVGVALHGKDLIIWRRQNAEMSPRI